MEAYQYHVYVCNQQKPDGVPCCHAHGSEKVISALRREIAKQGLDNSVQVTTSGSIGLCERGPNMVVYPEGIWYSGVTPDDVSEIVSKHFKSGQVVERLVNSDVDALRTEIDTNKKRMMAAFKARDEAGVLPEELMQKIRGFQESRIILTAVELDIFSAVNKHSSPEDISKQIGADTRATEMLLNALVALELLEKRNGAFQNTPIASRYLIESAPDDSRASLMHTVHLWIRWSTLTECVKEGTSVTRKTQSHRPPQWTDSFIAAMHKNALLRAPQVIRVVDAEGINRMLDVGGGSGAYSIAFARANKNLHAEIFDLPDVVKIAQKHIDDAGLTDRITTQAGDMRKDRFGNNFDLVFISAICHMNSPEQNKDLFKKSYVALSPGGKIVIQDFVLNDDKTSPKTAAMFALNMLVGTQSGSSYSESEYREWLGQAGFEDIKMIRPPGPTGILIAVRKK
jgi:(2Fe-2S) ferredoxin/ubiquinone/menaquinone biosynthesis C-methylase UbiE